MPAAAIAVPAAVSLLGANKQAQAQKSAANQAAAAAAPYGINSPMGNVNFMGHQVNASLGGVQQGQQDALNSLFSGGVGQGLSNTGGFQDWANALGNNALPSLFGNYLSAAGSLPSDAYAGNQNTLGNQQDLLSGLQANVFGGAQGSLMQALGGLQGSGNLFNMAQTIGGQDVSGLVNDRLSLLRQQAAPQEQQALNNIHDTLFQQGRLGAGDNAIGGANPEMQAFFNAQNQADLGRQVQAQNLGLQAQQQNTQLANMFGNLGLSGLQSMGNIGMQGLGQAMNLGNMIGNLSNSQFQNAGAYSDMGNSRALQMMQGAQGLFGFGNQLGQQNFTNAMTGLTGSQNMDTQLRNLIALGGNLGGAQGQALAPMYAANASSPVGSLLAGAGLGALQSGINNWRPAATSQFSPAWANIGSGAGPNDMGGAGVLKPMANNQGLLYGSYQ